MCLEMQEVSLGSWQLRMTSGEAGSSPIALFKVPRATTLPPTTTLTVWTDKAAEREKVAAEPPHVFIMKVENWNLSSKHVVISLLNNKGEARCNSHCLRVLVFLLVFIQCIAAAMDSNCKAAVAAHPVDTTQVRCAIAIALLSCRRWRRAR